LEEEKEKKEKEEKEKKEGEEKEKKEREEKAEAAGKNKKQKKRKKRKNIELEELETDEAEESGKEKTETDPAESAREEEMDNVSGKGIAPPLENVVEDPEEEVTGIAPQSPDARRVVTPPAPEGNAREPIPVRDLGPPPAELSPLTTAVSPSPLDGSLVEEDLAIYGQLYPEGGIEAWYDMFSYTPSAIKAMIERYKWLFRK
jgi:hypothetical protein